MKKKFYPFLFLLLISFLFLSPKSVRSASSENYKIDADVLGVGGDAGSSENFNLTDTIGEPIIGVGTSENYKSKAGFWYMINTAINLTVDSSTVNLGTITPGTPVTGESIVTVTTDSWGGYDLKVNEDNNMTHTDTATTIPDYSCDIASPCLWSGVGLGFTIKSGTGVDAKWGTNPNYKYAYFPEASTNFHEKTGFSSGGDVTTIGYKVDTAASQKAGLYTNTITYTALAKL